MAAGGNRSRGSPEWEQANLINKGALLFQIKCQRCHANTKGAVHFGAPNLWGVYGRKAGSAKGYKKYSPQLQKSGLVWTSENLTNYMHDPKKMVPGTVMFYGAALGTNVQTGFIVEYLKSLSDDFQRKKAEKYEKSYNSAAQAAKDRREVAAIVHPPVSLFGDENE